MSFKNFLCQCHLSHYQKEELAKFTIFEKINLYGNCCKKIDYFAKLCFQNVFDKKQVSSKWFQTRIMKEWKISRKILKSLEAVAHRGNRCSTDKMF